MNTWQRRTYFCQWCHTEVFDLTAPVGWLQVRIVTSVEAGRTDYRLVGFYCSFDCLAEHVRQWDPGRTADP
jgi:hypothetical protein